MARACSWFIIRVRIGTMRCRCHSSCRRSRFSGLGTQIRGKLSSNSNLSRSRASLESGLLLADSSGLNLRGVSDPQFDPQLCQQPLEPAGVSGGFHPPPHASRSRLQTPIELLRCSITVVQFTFATLSCLGVSKRDVLIARVIIHAYHQHVRLLSPEPMVVDKPQSTRVSGAGVVMQSSAVVRFYYEELSESVRAESSTHNGRAQAWQRCGIVSKSERLKHFPNGCRACPIIPS